MRFQIAVCEKFDWQLIQIVLRILISLIHQLPLTKKNILFKEKLKQLENIEQVGITTNGIMLTRLLVNMQRAGLDALNISLDTLIPKKYETITRRKGHERVLAGIDLAIQLGYKPKVNVVVIKGKISH